MMAYVLECPDWPTWVWVLVAVGVVAMFAAVTWVNVNDHPGK